MSGDADAAAFDDVDVGIYLDLVEGEKSTVGAVYKVKDDAEAPLDSARGKEFTIIGITPVLNSPVCFNNDAISEEERAKIVEYFCSEEVSSNPRIFVDSDDRLSKASSKRIRTRPASWRSTTPGTSRFVRWAPSAYEEAMKRRAGGTLSPALF